MEGRVTFSDTGEPLEMGTVVFMKEGFQARGDIRTGGQYTMGSLSERDGLPRGTYQVFITGAVQLEGTSFEGLREVPLVERKFTSPDTSGLTVEVDGSTRRFDFEVDRPARR